MKRTSTLMRNALCVAFVLTLWPALQARSQAWIEPAAAGPLPVCSVPTELPPNTFTGFSVDHLMWQGENLMASVFLPFAGEVTEYGASVVYAFEAKRGDVWQQFFHDMYSAEAPRTFEATINLTWIPNLQEGETLLLRLRVTGEGKTGWVSNEVPVQVPAPLGEAISSYWRGSFEGGDFSFVGVLAGAWKPSVNGEESYFSDNGVTIQWYRRNPHTWEMQPIEGATDSIYRIVLADLGYELVNQVSIKGFTNIHVHGFAPVIAPVFYNMENFTRKGMLINTCYDLPDSYLEGLTLRVQGSEDSLPPSRIHKVAPGQYALYFAPFSGADFTLLHPDTIHPPTAGYDAPPTHLNPYMYGYDTYISQVLESPPVTTLLQGEAVDVPLSVWRMSLEGHLTQSTEGILTGARNWLKAEETATSSATYYPGVYLLEDAQPVVPGLRSHNSYDFSLLPLLPAELGGEGSVSGRITEDEGSAGVKGLQPALAPGVEGYTVFLRKAGGGEMVAQTKTDGEGNYAFRRIPYGAYEVCVNAEGFTTEALHTVTLTEAQPEAVQVNYLLADGKVKVDEETGIALPSAVIGRASGVYSLSGARQGSGPLPRGIYLRNGQKVVVSR